VAYGFGAEFFKGERHSKARIADPEQEDHIKNPSRM